MTLEESKFIDAAGIDDLIRETADAHVEPTSAAGSADGEYMEGYASRPRENPFDRPTDSAGNVFDPELHATDKHGNPTLTSTGKFRRKRGAAQSQSRLNIPPDVTQMPQMNEQAMAMVATGVFISTGVMLFGEEWQPESDAEKNQLDKAFYDYFDHKGWDDIPPGIALVLCCGMYAAKRLHKPQTQSRIASFFGYLKGRYHGARAYFRSYRMRENNAGATHNQTRTRRWRSRFGL